ncbi:response regulator [Oleiphilus messinensis]|uniref:diguanylate cyclase n=1 Tax=Oleiphilus messinensis TaxID=141451 RepID=A0A1Y0IG78_9GAMM|nr:GGDEF domain-containing protein [Oleiphilus messinensis]ARU58394.1 response regulator [Oleiphilus messinensis]
MDSKLVEPKYRDQITRQLGDDLSRRSLIGTIVYLLIWAALMLPSMSELTNRGHNTALLICTAAVLTVSVLRLALVLFYREKAKKLNTPSLWPLQLGVFTSGAVWGLICYYLISTPAFADCTMSLFVATAGLCAGGITSLAPSKESVSIYLFTLVTPLAAGLLVADVPRATSIAWLFSIYVCGLYAISGLHRREYFSALNTKMKLVEQTERLSQLNTIDPLTGLKNRRFFETQLSYEFKRAVREESSIAIILLDLDYFKAINDQFGHLIGDECLKEMARTISCQLNRSLDIVARYGGEEFAVILPNTAQQDAYLLADKLRQKIEHMSIKVHAKTVQFTASFGLSTIIPTINDSEIELLSQADIALYAAKNNGRNRVEIFDPDSSASFDLVCQGAV